MRNFTDIDDKIIKRAAERGVPWQELAETLHPRVRRRTWPRSACARPTSSRRPPSTSARSSTWSPALVAKGKAYAVDGDVYFRVKAFPAYGELGQRDLEEMLAGARVEVDERKEDPMDFALWKSSKPGEPWWESPWGPGRPGWHIECSAMAMKHLGEQLDIHGGGKDLVFPHHENEIAQTEALTGRPFVRIWMHNGFVNVNHGEDVQVARQLLHDPRRARRSSTPRRCASSCSARTTARRSTSPTSSSRTRRGRSTGSTG